MPPIFCSLQWTRWESTLMLWISRANIKMYDSISKEILLSVPWEGSWQYSYTRLVCSLQYFSKYQSYLHFRKQVVLWLQRDLDVTPATHQSLRVLGYTMLSCTHVEVAPFHNVRLRFTCFTTKCYEGRLSWRPAKFTRHVLINCYSQHKLILTKTEKESRLETPYKKMLGTLPQSAKWGTVKLGVRAPSFSFLLAVYLYLFLLFVSVIPSLLACYFHFFFVSFFCRELKRFTWLRYMHTFFVCQASTGKHAHVQAHAWCCT